MQTRQLRISHRGEGVYIVADINRAARRRDSVSSAARRRIVLADHSVEHIQNWIQQGTYLNNWSLDLSNKVSDEHIPWNYTN